MEFRSPGDVGLNPESEQYDPLYNTGRPPPYADDLDRDFDDSESEHIRKKAPPPRSSSNSSQSISESSGSRPSTPKKYLLYPVRTTVQELGPGEVRWFYKEENDKKWTAFSGYDSLRIEYKYLALQQRMAENVQDSLTQNIDLISVRGALFEVDILHKKCYPIYWSGENSDIMRGTWFIASTWQPIEEGYATQIETEHMAKFRGENLTTHTFIPSPKTEKTVIHNIKFKEFHVDWNSPMDVYLYSEATSSRLYRTVKVKLGMQKSGTKLHRGYCEEATGEDKPPDISHLVFVIHGIGQKMDTGRIVKCSAELREVTNKLKAKYFPNLSSSNQRAEFIPVEWRSSLKLDGDIVDSITPHKIRGLRTILNSSAMDILYYTSPLYRSEITHGLQSELNRLYGMFVSRHPYFESTGGKVSIVAHSLGCVITYDIITGWNPIQLYDQYVTHTMEETSAEVEGAASLVSQIEEARKKVQELEMRLSETQHLTTPTLKFRLENFVCIGSPLAVFLALRGVRPKPNGTQDHLLPRSLCSRLFNIFHPADPIAYRLEPLVLKHYETILPLRVFRHDDPNKMPYVELKAKAYQETLKKPKELKEEWKDEEEDAKDELQEEISAVVEKMEKVEALETLEQLEKITAETDQKLESLDLDEKENEEKNVKKQSLRGRIGSIWSNWGKKSIPESTSDLSALSDSTAVLSSGASSQDDDELNDQPITVNHGGVEEMTTYKVTYEEHGRDSPSIRENGRLNVDDGIENVELEYRLDYMLKEGTMENQYLAALTSHTAYWANQDVGLFILTHLYPGYGPVKKVGASKS